MTNINEDIARRLGNVISRAEARHRGLTTDRIVALKGGATQAEVAQWNRDYPGPRPSNQWTYIATALLASPEFADLIREAQERAWSVGYNRATLDSIQDLEPADNPYEVKS